MYPHFLDIEYLKNGTKKQQMAYKRLKELNIFKELSDYKPLLAGTVPIRIDIEESDLDVICEVHNFEIFRKLLVQ